MKSPKDSTSAALQAGAGRPQHRREPRVSARGAVGQKGGGRARPGPQPLLGPVAPPGNRSSARPPALRPLPFARSCRKRPDVRTRVAPRWLPSKTTLPEVLPGPDACPGRVREGTLLAQEGAGWGDSRSPGPTGSLHRRGGPASPTHLRTLGGHARVVPRRGATVVVHEEGPAGLRVDLDLPARGQGVSVTGSVAGRHLHHWRLGCGAHAGSGSARGAELGRGSRGRGVRAPLRRRRVREAGAGHLYELKDWVTWPERDGSVWK